MDTAWSIAHHGEVDGLGVAEGLSKLSCVTCKKIAVGQQDWAVAVSELSTGNGIDISGASGPLDFDQQTEEIKKGKLNSGVCVARNQVGRCLT